MADTFLLWQSRQIIPQTFAVSACLLRVCYAQYFVCELANGNYSAGNKYLESICGKLQFKFSVKVVQTSMDYIAIAFVKVMQSIAVCRKVLLMLWII